jgi:hypothetical protein
MEDVGIFYGHLVLFMVIWDIFPVLAILYKEKKMATLLPRRMPLGTY